MDYKLNKTSNIECKDAILPGFPDLKFCSLGDEVVFNATEYCNASNIEDFDWRGFSRICKRFIEGMISATQLNRSLLFFQDMNGNIFINQGLAFLFLAYVSDDMIAYFNSLLADVLATGIAFSDDFVYSIASSRLPTQLLKQIVNSREVGE